MRPPRFSSRPAVPAVAGPVAVDSVVGDLAPSGAQNAADSLDVDLGQLQLDPADADTMGRQLGRLAAEQRGDQIQRLERGLLRLERSNLQVLALLQQLVSAVKKPSDEGPK